MIPDSVVNFVGWFSRNAEQYGATIAAVMEGNISEKNRASWDRSKLEAAAQTAQARDRSGAIDGWEPLISGIFGAPLRLFSFAINRRVTYRGI